MSTAVARPLKAKFNKKPVVEQYSREAQQRKMHYVYFYGAEPLDIHEIRCEYSTLKNGVIVPIDNYEYRDRRGDSSGAEEGRTPAPSYPGEDVKNEIMRPVRAGVIVEDLEILYGNNRGDGIRTGRGFVNLDCLIDQDIKAINLIEDILLPEPFEIDPDDSSKERIKSVADTREMIQAGLKKLPPELKALGSKVAKLLLEAVSDGARYMGNKLRSFKDEQERRKLPGGVGRGKLIELEHEFIRLTGRTAADFEDDIQATQKSLTEQMVAVLQAQQVPQSAITPETLSLAFAQALKAVGIGQPPAPTTPATEENKPKK